MSQFDTRIREYVLATNIVWQTSERGGSVKQPHVLLSNDTGQMTLENTTCCMLRSGDGHPGVLLDFGKEIHGGLQIAVGQTGNNQPVRLRIRFGESVGEAMADTGGPQNATNDHAVRDQTCSVPWMGSLEIGYTGFRFVRIDLVDEHNFIEIFSVRAVAVYRELEYKGSFQCSDERLNTVWQTGAYTVHLNMQEYLWDGIKRDRLVWIGDMHPEVMTINNVFGHQEMVCKSLDLVRDQTPLPQWMNGISSYSIWWLLIHDAWYRFHGDLNYLHEQKEYILGLLDLLMQRVDDRGWEKLPETRFLDWPSSGNDMAIHAGLQALLVLAFRAGADLCEVLNVSDVAGKCRETIEKMKSCRPDPNRSKQAAALLVLAGLANAEEMNRMILAVDGAKRVSTFYGYYILQARAMAGDYLGALECIRQYWGGMLQMGATSFWEDFDIEWMDNATRIDELPSPKKKDIHGDFGNYCYQGYRHSLCHGWASGPTSWLSEHVLGFQVVTAGCKQVRIAPHLGDLEWAEGTLPTPQGILKVRHEKQGEKVDSEIDAPQGVQIVGEEA